MHKQQMKFCCIFEAISAIQTLLIFRHGVRNISVNLLPNSMFHQLDTQLREFQRNFSLFVSP